MSVGVGRGRGRLPQQPNGDIEPLRRPNIAGVGRGRSTGPASAAAASKFLDVESALSDPSVDSVRMFKVLDDFLQTSPSQEDIDVLVKKVFEKNGRSKMNLDCICQCLYLASKHKLKGEELHMSLFNQLEKKFTGVDSSGDAGMPLWRFVNLFSSICHFVRNQKTQPFHELVDGLNKLCLALKQPGDSDQARIAAVSIARCCHHMRMSSRPAAQTEALMCKLRSMLLGCNSVASRDPDVTVWLCLGLEVSALICSNVQLPPSSLQYYCKNLGPEAASFNLIPPPTLNLPESTRSNYNFTDISYILNFI